MILYVIFFLFITRVITWDWIVTYANVLSSLFVLTTAVIMYIQTKTIRDNSKESIRNVNISLLFNDWYNDDIHISKIIVSDIAVQNNYHINSNCPEFKVHFLQ